MTESWTNRGKFLLANGGMGGRDLRMCVFTGTQTGVHSATLNTVADLDAVAGVSIHAERIALANKTVIEDDANNRANLDADNVTFAAAAGVTAQGVGIYVEGASDAARELCTVHTTGFPQPMDGGLLVQIPDWARVT